MALPFLSAAGNVLASRGAFFVYGAIAAPIVNKAAEPVAQFGRALLKSSIKGALIVGATLQNVVTEAKDGLGDVTAEVRADIAKSKEAQHHGNGADGEPVPAPPHA